MRIKKTSWVETRINAMNVFSWLNNDALLGNELMNVTGLLVSNSVVSSLVVTL